MKLKGHSRVANRARLTFTRGEIFFFFFKKKNGPDVGEDVGALESALGDKKKSAALEEPLAKHTAALQTLSQRAADCRRPGGSLRTAAAFR